MYRLNLKTKKLSRISRDRALLLVRSFPFTACFWSKDAALEFVRGEELKRPLVLKGLDISKVYDVFYN